ncbi:MAG: hypothetical protein IPN03_01495 [Holophagales bacterium]|nr:hypothetical protein [Holophagales bacterium]
MTTFLLLALALALDPERAVPATPTAVEAPRNGFVDSTATALPIPTPRPEDKTLVASLDVEQGAGKDRLSLYRDGTLVLVKTYEGVRKVKKKVLSEEEIGIIRKVCREALSLDVSEYHVDVLGDAKPRRFRIEVGRNSAPPRVFQFDELARVPLVLGRARGSLEGLLDRFDETTVSQDDLWDPSGLRRGDVLTHRTDGMRYRIDRDDAFVRSLEMVEVVRSLQRLIILREDVPKLFLDPSGEDEGGARR